MIHKYNKSGFTLIELIIVLIIIGILVTLAIPTFQNQVQRTYSAEADRSIGSLRESVLRCNFTENNFANCPLASLDVDDPGGAANAHFTYAVGNTGASIFTVTATRNAVDGGDTADSVYLTQDDNVNTVVRGGTTIWVNL